jgi:predicted dehydrogenase
MDLIKVVVVGVGHLGSRHARIYSELPGVELVGVLDSDRERTKEIAEQYNCLPFTKLEDIPSSVEAISVVVPTDRHYEVAAELMERGYHLLIEKPITDNVSHARELLRLAERSNLLIQVGHVERFNPGILEIEKIVKAPRFIECHRNAPFQPRGTEVGVVLDLMIHDLDIILYLVSSPVASLEAVGATVLSQHEDIANARIKFKSGCIANITTSRVSPSKMRKIRIFQDDAYISLDYMAQTAQIYRKEAGRIFADELQIPRGEPLKLELESFMEAVRLGGKPQVPAEGSLAALEVAVAVTEEVAKSEKRLAKIQENPGDEWER